MQSLEAKQIFKGMQIEISTALTLEIWNHTQYPPGEKDNAKHTLLANKHIFLKDTIGDGYVSYHCKYVLPMIIVNWKYCTRMHLHECVCM